MYWFFWRNNTNQICLWSNDKTGFSVKNNKRKANFMKELRIGSRWFTVTNSGNQLIDAQKGIKTCNRNTDKKPDLSFGFQFSIWTI